MYSITTALAADTQAPPPPATGSADATTGILNWLSETLPGGNVTLLGAAAVAYLLVKHRGAKGGMTAEDGQKADKAALKALKGAWNTLVSLVKAPWAVIRFYGGYETRGEPKSTATFFKAGTRTDRPAKPAPTISMASIAAAPPKISLTKKGQPSPWARNTAAWIASYKGKGSRALDRALRAVLWTTRAARRVHGWYKAVARVVRTIHGTVAPVVTTLARAATSWHCWPYALRGLARLGATAALLGLLVPAWRTPTVLLLVLAVAAATTAAARHKPKPLGDDVVYGPKLWTVLAHDLGLPADEPWEQWLHLPARLADPAARITIRLPWTFRGAELERQQLAALINSRVPGEWVARFSFTGEHATAVYTHKPPPAPPKPEPEPPTAVDIWDPKVQQILATLGPDEFYLGQDTFDQPIIQKMSDEQAHWAMSVGSGGGKSAFLQFLAIQMLMKRGTVVVIDGKMVSMTPLIGIQGTHAYINPQAPRDMRATLKWVADVVNARNYQKKNGTQTDFPPLYLILEECNHLADILKEEYTANKDNGAPAGDPIWRDGVAPVLRLGREVNVHIIAVFQDFKDTQFGGISLVPLFPFKILGSYSERQWKRIMGASFPMPTIQKKAGRMVLALDTGDVTRIQTPYVPWVPELTKADNQQHAYKLLTAYYKELRATHGYDSRGLYEAPPEHSPEVEPALLRRASRDKAHLGQIEGPEGGQVEETAGRLSREGASVTGSEGDVTASRDRLRLIPGQGGQGAPERAQDDPTAPPELLPLAEVARRLEGEPGIPKADTMRAHKKRKDDFPRGIGEPGKELYTVSQIRAYYQPQENVAP
ncbi:hypothetical protein [Streptomyces laurentii]|uniref:hypothetical protein n=1 Tax=Streptomyces laurentii TaxID=39478 RepID=UPI0033E28632